MALFNATAYAQNVPGYITNSDNLAVFLWKYLALLPSLVVNGDYFAIMVVLIIGYVLLLLINMITGLFLVVIKKTISLAVTILALLMIYNKFEANLGLEGFSIKTLLIGLVGLGVAVLGITISSYSLLHHTTNAFLSRKAEKDEGDTKKVEFKEKKEMDIGHLKDYKSFFSVESMKNDRSLLSVITFLMVAEFGVFSTKTISAPTAASGLMIFIIFMVVSFVFIKQSYRDYKKGITHIMVTFVLGSVLAVFLGHFWEGLPFSVLFSMQVFTTDVIVALISGMGLSLFAGSKSAD
jgi:hypothetical protein